jgi:hypothetical protein
MSKKSIIPELVDAASNRRSFVRKLGIASAAAGALAVTGDIAEAATGPTSTDVQVLNFALNLEYLESSFYSYAVNGTDITAFGIGIDGVANGSNPPSGGMATGGSKVNFSNNLVFSSDIAAQIASDERAHVKLLRSALGSSAIARPNINLDALGFGFANESDFLKLARIFEDIGVSAYAGAASLLSPAVITTAAQILAAEAEHTSSIRVQVARLNVHTAPPLDGVDILPPPDGSYSTILSVNPSNGLVATRTPGQVLYLAFGNKANATSGGFFPNGVNGAITTSSGPA